MMRCFKIALLSFFFLSCAASRQVNQHEAYFDLYLDISPKDALIEVDGAMMGKAEGLDKNPLRLIAGTKRILIKREGYYQYRYSLEYIQPGEVYTLKTSLIRSAF